MLSIVDAGCYYLKYSDLTVDDIVAEIEKELKELKNRIKK